jgi:hypothetical protein
MLLGQGQKLPNRFHGIFVVLADVGGGGGQMKDTVIEAFQKLEKKGGLAKGDLADVGLVVQQNLDFAHFHFALLQQFPVGPCVPWADPQGTACQMLDIPFQTLHGFDQLEQREIEIHNNLLFKKLSLGVVNKDSLDYYPLRKKYTSCT